MAIAVVCKPKARLVAENLARENPFWGQQRIQGELAGLGFTVCALTVAKYMRRPWNGQPSPGWRQFLAQHAKEIWACDLFTVQTIWFRTFYVFFVIHHGSITQIRTPVRAPKANTIAERWVRTVRAECLDHRLVLGHQHLQRLIDEYVAYYSDWRPHRSQEQQPRAEENDAHLSLATESWPTQSLAGSTMSIDSQRDLAVRIEFLRPSRVLSR